MDIFCHSSVTGKTFFYRDEGDEGDHGNNKENNNKEKHSSPKTRTTVRSTKPATVPITKNKE